MAAASSRPELLVIVGPTASGKSALAMKISRACGGEIISADSWQVYRGFDIGTSKPSKTEQAQIKHYLIDVAEAQAGFNAPKFKELAQLAVNDIQNGGKLPILVGGTGLYIDSLLFDFGFLPTGDKAERAKLDRASISQLLETARKRNIDLSGIDIRNKRRIIRAIEAKGQKPSKKAIKKGVLTVGLDVGHEKLRQQIEHRTEQMIKAGLEEEVRTLADRYGWEIEPMKGIGYQQWRGYFEGEQDLDETKQKIVKATTDLAKRQMTWFKRNPHIKWFDSADEAYIFLTKHL